MSALEQQREEPRSSVKITLNAKGEAQAEVKVYAGDSPTELQTAQTAAHNTFLSTVAWLKDKGFRP